MTQDFFTTLVSWFKWGWELMTSIYLPGTNVTPAGMLLFGASAVIGIRFVKGLFEVQGGQRSNEKD